jgi:photosystem II stability/assembly factor-like uncharacterized protein
MNYLYALCAILLIVSACAKESISPNYYTSVNSGTTLSLQTIRFVSADTGYIVGGETYTKSIILRTINGGETWQPLPQSDLAGKMIYDIVPTNDNAHIWASALDNKLLHSQDAGNTWEDIQIHTSGIAWQPLRSLWALGDSLLFVVGGQATFTGLILRFNRNDYSYTYQTPMGQLNDMCFTNTSGYACGYGIAYRSTDMGNTWTYMEVRGDDFTAIHFPSETVGYMLGAKGSIFKTNDSGTTWEKIYGESLWDISGRSQFNELLFQTEQSGWVAGNGLLWHTNDGGNTWQSYEGDFNTAQLNSITQHPNGDIWAVGEEGNIWRIVP